MCALGSPYQAYTRCTAFRCLPCQLQCRTPSYTGPFSCATRMPAKKVSMIMNYWSKCLSEQYYTNNSKIGTSSAVLLYTTLTTTISSANDLRIAIDISHADDFCWSSYDWLTDWCRTHYPLFRYLIAHFVTTFVYLGTFASNIVMLSLTLFTSIKPLQFI